MTDKSVLIWINEVLGVGTVNPKRYKTPYTVGWKKQWRWRCQHRDAYFVLFNAFSPYAHVKLNKIQKIIDHYSTKLEVMNGKVVSLEEYKRNMSLNEFLSWIRYVYLRYECLDFWCDNSLFYN